MVSQKDIDISIKYLKMFKRGKIVYNLSLRDKQELQQIIGKLDHE